MDGGTRLLYFVLGDFQFILGIQNIFYLRIDVSPAFSNLL
jgi:hypothetical protein